MNDPFRKGRGQYLTKKYLKDNVQYIQTLLQKGRQVEKHMKHRDASKKQSITTLPNKIQRTGTETNPERERIVVSTGQEDRSVENANRDVPADTTNQHGIQVERHEHQQ